MDLAAFSPKKFQLLNQSSPRSSAGKRILFPTNSPQCNDLGLIGELSSSDNSDVYSPPLASPSSSLSPGNDGTSYVVMLDRVSRVANHLEFSTSPRRSPRIKGIPKDRMRSLRKDNFENKFLTLLSDGDDGPVESENSVQYDLSSDNFSTPKKNSSTPVRRSPRSASKREAEPVIKPTTFYGSIAPLLATNQTNRIQGIKCVFRPPKPSRAKAKLLFDDKPKAKKRERSRSSDVMREAKKRKAVYTGVHHTIPRPVKNTPLPQETKNESIRGKARRLTDLSRTPYGVKRKKPEGWEYTMRFPKPVRNGEPTNFKYFKTSIKDPRTLLSPGSSSDSSLPSPTMKHVAKKRMLLDPRKDYLGQKSPLKPKLNAADIRDMINDLEVERSQEMPEVEDILLRLEEDDDREKKKEAETLVLMNLLEDSSSDEFCSIDSLSNCTASLDLNDSLSGSKCSRFSLDDAKENKGTPQRIFSVFNKSSAKKVLSDATNSSRKQKWRGLGEDQLQIDAGQKRFGARQCAECGMVYQAGEAEDEMQHSAFHDNLNTLRHTGWKNEHVVGRFGMDHAIVITAADPKNWQQKAADVLALVDKSLGITTESLSHTVMHNQKVFLYVAERRVVGCVVVGPVSRAYQLLCSESDVDLCSEESFPVKCGISRVWTLFSHRRHGVASRLLDTVRRNFMYGYILPKEEIAFSIPTPAGKRFAAKYMGSPNFMVYTGY